MSMTNFEKPNHIQYDEWFDNNIDPCELENDKEKRFSDFVHEKFFKMSQQNIIIGGSDSVIDFKKHGRCSGGFCSLTDEELKQI